MNVKDYFVKGKNYFIALIIVTALRALTSIFALYPRIGFLDPISIINLFIVGFASFKLRLGFKQSALLGVLMFCSIIWYLPFAMPGIVFTLDWLSMTLILSVNIGINASIYAGTAIITYLISKKLKGKKKK